MVLQILQWNVMGQSCWHMFSVVQSFWMVRCSGILGVSQFTYSNKISCFSGNLTHHFWPQWENTKQCLRKLSEKHTPLEHADDLQITKIVLGWGNWEKRKKFLWQMAVSICRDATNKWLLLHFFSKAVKGLFILISEMCCTKQFFLPWSQHVRVQAWLVVTVSSAWIGDVWNHHLETVLNSMLGERHCSCVIK